MRCTNVTIGIMLWKLLSLFYIQASSKNRPFQKQFLSTLFISNKDIMFFYGHNVFSKIRHSQIKTCLRCMKNISVKSTWTYAEIELIMLCEHLKIIVSLSVWSHNAFLYFVCTVVSTYWHVETIRSSTNSTKSYENCICVFSRCDFITIIFCLPWQVCVFYLLIIFILFYFIIFYYG